MSDFVDLNWPIGQDNMGGLVGDLFWIATPDVDEAQLPTMDADGVSLTGNIVPKATKHFIKIYHTKGTGKIDDTGVGERDGKSSENTCEFFFPGAVKTVEAFKRKVKNTPGVLIGRDTENNLRVLGICELGGVVSLDLPCYLEANTGTSGAASADRRGTTFTFKAEAPHSPLFYSGTIPLEPAL
jgi:hypothetical protein